MIRLDVFRCVPLSCELTVERCGERHAKRMMTCGTCTVGAAHEAGETPTTWSDGTPIARRGLEASTQAEPPPRRHVERIRDRGSEPLARPRMSNAERLRGQRERQRARRERAGAAPPRGQLYAWGDQALTLAQLTRTPEARAANLQRETIRNRLLSGWSVQRAVTEAAAKSGPQNAKSELRLAVEAAGVEWGLYRERRRRGRTHEEAIAGVDARRRQG